MKHKIFFSSVLVVATIFSFFFFQYDISEYEMVTISTKMHHLGDGHFSSNSNCAQQFVTSEEGIEYNSEFKIESRSVKVATLVIEYICGLENGYPPIAIINSADIGELQNGENIVFPIPVDVLRTNGKNNELKITTTLNGNDYDDFELKGISIVINEERPIDPFPNYIIPINDTPEPLVDETASAKEEQNKRYARTLEELAEILIKKGTPQRQVDSWRQRLRNGYTLKKSAWKQLIDEFFYSNNNEKHHDWKGFELYVQGRAVGRSQTEEMRISHEFLTKSYGVSDSVWEKVLQKYQKDGLYNSQLSKENKESFFSFLYDELIDVNASKDIQSLLSEETKKHFAKLGEESQQITPKSSQSNGLIIRPATKSEASRMKQDPCSYSACHARLLKTNPGFGILVQKERVGRNFGSMGYANTLRLIRFAVLIEMEACKKK